MANARYFLLDYRAWIIGILGLLAVFAYYLFAWNAVGPRSEGRHDHPALPPAGGRVAGARQLHPATGALARTRGRRSRPPRCRSRCAGCSSSTRRTKGTLTLERTDAPADVRDVCRPASGRCSHWVEGRGRPRRDQPRQRQIGRRDRSQAFKKSVEKEGGGRYFRRNLGWFFVGVALSRRDRRWRSSSSAA